MKMSMASILSKVDHYVKSNYMKYVEWFLRIAIAMSFLSASADRFGLWPTEVSAWGNWTAFVEYTGTLLFFLPDCLVHVAAIIATALEVTFGIALLTTYKTPFFAFGSGILLLIFALGMVISLGIKAPFDYSVFSASAAAFALSAISVTKTRTKYHI